MYNKYKIAECPTLGLLRMSQLSNNVTTRSAALKGHCHEKRFQTETVFNLLLIFYDGAH